MVLVVNAVFSYFRKPLDIDKIIEEAEEKEKQAETYKNEAQILSESLKAYQKKNIKLRQKIETMSKPELVNYGIFLDSYATENDKFYSGLIKYHESLISYDNSLRDYRNALDKELMRITLNPYVLLWKKENILFGGGVDLSIPITTKISIIGGIGYYKEPFIKLGAGFKF